MRVKKGREESVKRLNKKGMLTTLVLVLVSISYLNSCHKPKYQAILIPQNSEEKTDEGWVNATYRLIQKPTPGGNEELKNGAKYSLDRNWAPPSAHLREEEDYSVFIFKIIDGSVSGNIEHKHYGDKVSAAEEKAKSNIRNWRYQGDRQGWIAMKIDWPNNSILIDTTKFRGNSKIKNIRDLVKNAPLGFTGAVRSYRDRYLREYHEK